MDKIPLLWSSPARKEAMELLQTIWNGASEADRQRLSQAIDFGPPSALIERLATEDQKSSRDRRMFDRLAVLERIQGVELTAELQNLSRRLHDEYPNWRLPVGEQAHFSIWMETPYGHETQHDADELGAMPIDELVNRLTTQSDFRSKLVDKWQDLVEREYDKAIEVFVILTQQPNTPTDVLSSSIYGFRKYAKQTERRVKIIFAALELSSKQFADPQVLYGISAFLAEVARGSSGSDFDTNLLNLYDRAALAAVSSPEAPKDPLSDDWVTFAINSSIGKLAEVLLAILFSRDLKVGMGLPSDLQPRLDFLILGNEPGHRIARVIAASRLSYLFAVDSDWVSRNLISSFNWSDEEEANAVWQGYGWQPRIDEKLWQALKPSFILLFQPARLARLDSAARNFAQLLMLVGIEFGVDELARDEARNVIRQMSNSLRVEALSWAVLYLQRVEDEKSRIVTKKEMSVDEKWKTKVWPWINKIWPVDPEIKSFEISDQFALMAIATNASFTQAVDVLKQYLVKADSHYPIHRLRLSTHPDAHPITTLELVDAIVDPQRLFFVRDDISDILARVRIGQPSLARVAAFVRLNERVQNQN